MKDLEKALKIEDGVLVECDCDFSGELVIPDSVKKIDNQAFYACDNLTSVVIPDSVMEIDSYAFDSCK
ncbi:MAG: leucine-rich repeat protein, partial [Bacteroidales bacterium]|nr:leucine-rich repeat protein [Bacteroidales bacterium]